MTNSTTTFLISDQDYSLREPHNAQELVHLVQNTIAQIQDRFGQMSDTIMNRIDEMGRRIDDLEHNIAHIMSQTNAQLP